MKSLDRLRTYFRFNWLRWLILFGGIAVAWLLVRGGVSAPPGSFEASLYLVLAGAALTAVGKSVIDLATRSEAYRQGAYTERAKAVQEVLKQARATMTLALEFVGFTFASGWLVLAKQEGGQREVETQLNEAHERSRDLARYHRVWLGGRGEDAVVEFLEVLSENEAAAPPQSKEAAGDLIRAALRKLESRLMADLDYTPE